VALLVCVHGGLVKRDAGYGAAAPAYGAAPAPSYAAPAQAYAPAPVPSYGGSSYGAPSYGYYEEKPDLKAKLKEKLEDFKEKVIGTLAYIKGSILAKKGELYLKKAAKLQEEGEKLSGIGQSLIALKHNSYAAPAPVASYGAAPAPAYPAPSAY